MSTRKEATAARKQQIVRAAIALLTDRGYQATTFDAICQTAGLSSKRLITYHFAGKDDLFAAVADHGVAVAEGEMRPLLEAAADPGQLLAAVIRASVAFTARHRAEGRALQEIILNREDAWEKHYKQSIQQLADLLANGQRAGAFRDFDPQIMAAALRAAIDSMYQPIAAGTDPTTCANEMVDLFDRATGPEKPCGMLD
jgi:AcrR family transcriptional regulator